MMGNILSILTSAVASLGGGAFSGKAELPAHNLWYRSGGAATYAHASDWAFMWIFWIAVFWFVLLMGLMTYFVFKYRRKPGQAAEPSAHHNTNLEIAWTVIPTLIMVWMFIVGFKGYSDMAVPKGGGIDVDLTAWKWNWKVTYPNGAESRESWSPTEVKGFQATDTPVFYFPEKTPVRMRMISQDVMHSFWVPDFRYKVDVMPKRYTRYWFESEAIDASKWKRVLPAAESGLSKDYTCVDHWVFCAEYCGDQHSEMAAIIRIVPQEAFDEWLEKNGVGALPPVELGRLRWEQNCKACHTIDGKQGTGPTWKDLYGSTRQFTDGTSQLADDDYIRESMYYPARKISQGFANQMQVFALPEKDVQAIIAFMKSVSANAPADANGGANGAGGGGGGGEGSTN